MKNIKNSSIVVHVQWDAVDDLIPTSYTVNWNSERDQSQAAIVAEQEYTITGLSLDRVYTITVAAANCGQGSKFTTTVSFYTSTISPTFTANINPMTIISTVNPSVTSITTTTAVVSTADYTDPSFDDTTAIMIPTTTIVSNPTNSADTTTVNETSKSLTTANIIHSKINYYTRCYLLFICTYVRIHIANCWAKYVTT